jgi:ribonuclease HII
MNATGTGRQYGGEVRATDLMVHERAAVSAGRVVVGIDEVGRGALAGPLTVGAVLVTGRGDPPDGLADSKALTTVRREALVAPIAAWAEEWSLGWVSAQEIDRWGLRVAIAVAATRALSGLTSRPDLCLVDGPVNLLRAPADQPLDDPAPPLGFSSLECRTLVGGDSRCATIAAASVLAKVSRDLEMVDLDAQFPVYGWRRNKGYGVPEHLRALRRFGPTVQHRSSWRLPPRDGWGGDDGLSEPGAFDAKE